MIQKTINLSGENTPQYYTDLRLKKDNQTVRVYYSQNEQLSEYKASIESSAPKDIRTIRLRTDPNKYNRKINSKGEIQNPTELQKKVIEQSTAQYVAKQYYAYIIQKNMEDLAERISYKKDVFKRGSAEIQNPNTILQTRKTGSNIYNTVPVASLNTQNFSEERRNERRNIDVVPSVGKHTNNRNVDRVATVLNLVSNKNAKVNEEIRKAATKSILKKGEFIASDIRAAGSNIIRPVGKAVAWSGAGFGLLLSPTIREETQKLYNDPETYQGAFILGASALTPFAAASYPTLTAAAGFGLSGASLYSKSQVPYYPGKITESTLDIVGLVGTAPALKTFGRESIIKLTRKYVEPENYFDMNAPIPKVENIRQSEKILKSRKINGGYKVIHVSSKSLPNYFTSIIGKKALTGFEDPGTYVSGKGFSYFTGLNNAKNKQYSINPFAEWETAKPSVNIFSVKKIKNYPSSVLEKPGFDPTFNYQLALENKNIALITKRSLIGQGNILGQRRNIYKNIQIKNGKIDFGKIIGRKIAKGTKEPEAVLPIGAQYIKANKKLYTKLYGRVVTIDEYYPSVNTKASIKSISPRQSKVSLADYTYKPKPQKYSLTKNTYYLTKKTANYKYTTYNKNTTPYYNIPSKYSTINNYFSNNIKSNAYNKVNKESYKNLKIKTNIYATSNNYKPFNYKSFNNYSFRESYGRGLSYSKPQFPIINKYNNNIKYIKNKKILNSKNLLAIPKQSKIKRQPTASYFQQVFKVSKNLIFKQNGKSEQTGLLFRA